MDAQLPQSSEAAREAFGAIRAFPAVPVLAVVLAVALTAVLLPGLRLTLPSGASNCVSRGISTPQAREGTCTRELNGDGRLTTYSVVDIDHELHMPEYSVRLVSRETTPTHVESPRGDLTYPEGPGLLLSFELILTNTGARPLDLAQGAAPGGAPHYPAHPTVELGVPEHVSTEDGTALTDAVFPAILDPAGAPSPSVFRRVAPHTTTIGWVTVVAPPAAGASMFERPADLIFRRADGGPYYVGQIRLWK